MKFVHHRTTCSKYLTARSRSALTRNFSEIYARARDICIAVGLPTVPSKKCCVHEREQTDQSCSAKCSNAAQSHQCVFQILVYGCAAGYSAQDASCLTGRRSSSRSQLRNNHQRTWMRNHVDSVILRKTRILLEISHYRLRSLRDSQAIKESSYLTERISDGRVTTVQEKAYDALTDIQLLLL
ncbi:hypothetical protein BKA93DRAFT_350216 [Sparassis latifolia]